VTDKILLITPPDKIFNQNYSIVLIFPSDAIKKQAQEILAKSNGQHNIYLYNVDDDDSDVDWLLSVCKMCDVVILDYDNCSNHVKQLSSYIVSLSHTYWLTGEDKMQYNKLSPNRIYGLDIIEDLMRGSNEEQ